MLKPSKNISKFGKKELDQIFATAICAKRNQAFTILKHPSALEFGRVLIIVSKKYGNAVRRNKLRRQLKSIFLQNHLYKIGQDIIVITRPKAKNYTFTMLTELLTHVTQQS